jgi:pyruvate-formate lyase-activating enzyme
MENGGHYSALKFIHHANRLVQLQQGQQIIPLHLQLIISDLCSQSCGFCSYRWDGNISNQLFHVIDPKTGEKNHNPARFIPLEKCREIIDDCAEMGVKAIQFTGGGEPTVHSGHHEAFKYALDAGLECSLVTHGVLLRPEVMDTLMRFSWLRVSVDAGCAATYSKIRRVSEAQYGRAITNIGLLCKKRDESGSKIVIGMGFVVTHDNWSEVLDACRTAKSLGVDSFRISAVFQPDGDAYFADFYDEASKLCEEAETLAEGKFFVANSFGKRLADLRQGAPDYKKCLYQEFTTYIGATLQVFRCCNTAYNERGLIGSIADRRFKDLWLSEEKQADFRSFDARGCERCQFNIQNKWMNYSIDPTAKHVNFV